MFDHNQTFIVNWALSTGHLPLCQYSFMATTAVGLGMTGSVSPTDWGGSLLVTWGCRPQRWHLPLAILVCGTLATEVTSTAGVWSGVLATEVTSATGVWSVGHRGDINSWCVECAPEIPATSVWSVCHRDTCYWCVECWPQRYLLLVCGVLATETSATGCSGVWSVCHRDDVYGWTLLR